MSTKKFNRGDLVRKKSGKEDDDVAAMLREIGFEFSTVCFDIAPMENAPAATSATASSRKPGVEHGN